MTTLLLIRPEAQSRRLAAALERRGLRPVVVVSPVIEIHPRQIAIPQGCDLVLTSQNAIAALPPGRWRAWCVGDRTAEAARAAGLDATSAGGNVDDLVSRLLRESPRALVHVRGVHSTGDLAPRLRAQGIPTEDVVAYDQTARPLTSLATDALAASGDVVLPLYSPRSATLVAAHAGPWAASLHVVAISPAAAAAFGRPARTTLAEAPTGAAMLDALEGVLRAADGTRLVDRGGAG